MIYIPNVPIFPGIPVDVTSDVTIQLYSSCAVGCALLDFGSLQHSDVVQQDRNGNGFTKCYYMLINTLVRMMKLSSSTR